jgi:hypothetical protein
MNGLEQTSRAPSPVASSRMLGTLLALVLIGTTQRARAQDSAAQAPEPAAVSAAPAVSDGVLHAALASWGCQASDVLEVSERWYVACGQGGVLVIARGDAGSLVLLERRLSSGQARALFSRGGTVWVESTLTEAHPLTELAQGRDAPASGPLGAVASPVRAAAPPLAGHAPAPPSPAPSWIAPARVGDLWTIEGALRPYLPLSSLSFAGMVDATLTYRGDRPWYAQVKLSPFGGVVGTGPDAALFGAIASGGYDHPYFAVGIGVGVLRRGQRHGEFDQISQRFREWTEHSAALTVTQSARLGALDGLSLNVTNAFALDEEKWLFGFVDVAIQVPINRQTWIVAQGGGGEQAGYFYAELGLRRMLRGSRDSGSLFVRPSIGVAGVDNRQHEGLQPGPMVGFHVEWRK